VTDIRGSRSIRMMQDPNLGGDTLLVGLVLAARIDFGLKLKGLKQLAAIAFPDGPERANYYRAQRAFKDDIRTYRPPRRGLDEALCDAPMVRREGTCGRRASSSAYLTDWSTGEMTHLSSCSRHYAWQESTWRRNRAEKPDVVPLPAANWGGHLRMHLPEFNWPKFWARLDPRWVEHPETQSWPKPQFNLVLGDGESEGATARPLLTVASGGDR
jgi:hypothetical protein